MFTRSDTVPQYSLQGWFQSMHPDEILRLLADQVDVIGPERQKEDALFRSLVCPVCGGRAPIAVVDPLRPFTAGQILARKIGRCRRCQTEFDPETGLVRHLSGG